MKFTKYSGREIVFFEKIISFITYHCKTQSTGWGQGVAKGKWGNLTMWNQFIKQEVNQRIISHYMYAKLPQAHRCEPHRELTPLSTQVVLCDQMLSRLFGDVTVTINVLCEFLTLVLSVRLLPSLFELANNIIGQFHAKVNQKICRLEIVFDRLWYPCLSYCLPP